MKPITHLLGNKIVAQRYLWFAERKLTELKMVMRLQNLEFGQRMYRLPNDSVEVFIESYLGVDKIRIKATKELINTIGDVAVTFPAPAIPQDGNSEISLFESSNHVFEIPVTSTGVNVTTTAKIWDASGSVLLTGGTITFGFTGTTVLFGNNTLPYPLFNGSIPHYYGVQWDWNSGAGELKAIDRDAGFSDNYRWDGVSAWVTDSHSIRMQWNKYINEGVAGPRFSGGNAIFTGSGITTTNPANVVLASSSVTTSRIAVEITQASTITGGIAAYVGRKLMGQY